MLASNLENINEQIPLLEGNEEESMCKIKNETKLPELKELETKQEMSPALKELLEKIRNRQEDETNNSSCEIDEQIENN